MLHFGVRSYQLPGADVAQYLLVPARSMHTPVTPTTPPLLVAGHATVTNAELASPTVVLGQTCLSSSLHQAHDG